MGVVVMVMGVVNVDGGACGSWWEHLTLLHI